MSFLDLILGIAVVCFFPSIYCCWCSYKVFQFRKRRQEHQRQLCRHFAFSRNPNLTQVSQVSPQPYQSISHSRVEVHPDLRIIQPELESSVEMQDNSDDLPPTYEECVKTFRLNELRY